MLHDNEPNTKHYENRGQGNYIMSPLATAFALLLRIWTHPLSLTVMTTRTSSAQGRSGMFEHVEALLATFEGRVETTGSPPGRKTLTFWPSRRSASIFWISGYADDNHYSIGFGHEGLIELPDNTTPIASTTEAVTRLVESVSRGRIVAFVRTARTRITTNAIEYDEHVVVTSSHERVSAEVRDRIFTFEPWVARG